jgi:hypothetical protein
VRDADALSARGPSHAALFPAGSSRTKAITKGRGLLLCGLGGDVARPAAGAPERGSCGTAARAIEACVGGLFGTAAGEEEHQRREREEMKPSPEAPLRAGRCETAARCCTRLRAEASRVRAAAPNTAGSSRGAAIC